MAPFSGAFPYGIVFGCHERCEVSLGTIVGFTVFKISFFKFTLAYVINIENNFISLSTQEVIASLGKVCEINLSEHFKVIWRLLHRA